MPVHPVGLHERHRGGDTAEELVVRCGGARPAARATGATLGAAGGGTATLGHRRRPAARRSRRARRQAPLVTDGAGTARFVGALEELSPRGIDGLGVVEVLLEQLPDVSGVEPR